ncbi:MAG: TlpA disulfide reductase family protein, partial [Armatimonadetes bacterium]|nr:TlpA disulfide reductase family protein [Armatimonadota bacterium]
WRLIFFWSISCPSCHVNMPELCRVRDAFAGKGLMTIAIHRPMNDSDLEVARTIEVAKTLGVEAELVFDNDHSIGDQLDIEAWPTYFLFDAEGKLRRKAAGQLGIRMIEQSLIRMLGEPDEKVEVQSDEETVRVHAG